MTREKPKFEDALAALEKIVAEMETGELKLDDMLKRFERGKELADYCAAELDSIRQRIEKVTSAATTEPLDLTKP